MKNQHIILNAALIAALVIGVFVLFIHFTSMRGMPRTDAFADTVKQACLPFIANGVPIDVYLKNHDGEEMSESAAARYLEPAFEQKAYTIQNGGNEFILAITHQGRACSVFAKRLDQFEAEKKVLDVLKLAGFTYGEAPKEINAFVITAYYNDFSATRMAAVVNVSLEDSEKFYLSVSILRKDMYGM